MAAFPKYHELICDTYTPNFTASSAPCVLQTQVLVSKSRLENGGTFFRSIQDGGSANVNSINLECVITHISDDGTTVTEDVDFTITDTDGNITSLDTITQIFSRGSPNLCVQSGFDQLRDALNVHPVAKNVVEIPLDDSDASNGSGWNLVGSPLSTQGAEPTAYCFITAFNEDMSGAVVLPAVPDGSDAIRTGPAYTLFHIQTAETEPNGAITDVNALSEWDGTKWIPHPSPLYAPFYGGSPLAIITPHPECPDPTPIP